MVFIHGLVLLVSLVSISCRPTPHVLTTPSPGIVSEDALVGYDCQAAHLSIAAVSTANVEACKISPDPPVTESKPIQLVQLNDIAAVAYRMCKVVVTRSIMHCGMHSHSSAVRGGLASYIRTLGSAVCNQAHDTGTLQHGLTVMSDLRPNSTTSRLVVMAGSIGYDGSCSGASYSDEFGNWEGVVVQGQLEISLVSGMLAYDLSSNEIVLPDGVRCSYAAGGCFKSSLGEFFWKPSEETSCDLKKYSVLYQGLVQWTLDDLPYSDASSSGRTLVSVAQEDRVFSFVLDKRTHLCQFPAFSTEHPRIFVVPASEGVYPFSENLRHSHDIDIMMFINSKFVYVERHIKTQILEMYKDIMLRRCEDKRQHLGLSLALSRVSPNDFAFAYTEEPGYTALLRGEVIYIAQCVPTPVVVRYTEVCYQELPVSYNDQAKFLTPRGRIITDQGTEIPCSTILPPGYRLMGSWYYLHPRLTPGIAPHSLSPNTDMVWTYKTTRNLATSGIYSQDDMTHLRKQLIFPLEKPAVENILVRQVTGGSVGDQGIDTGVFFKPDLHERITSSVTSRLWGWLGWFGQYMSIMVGIIWVVKLIQYLFNVGVNGAMLFGAFGWGFKLLAALSESLSNCLLHRNLREVVFRPWEEKQGEPHHAPSAPDYEDDSTSSDESRPVVSETPQSTAGTSEPTAEKLYPPLGSPRRHY